MPKERLAALVIGLIMIMSMAGFALMGMSRFPQDQPPGVSIPHIVNRALTQEEKVYVLQTGRVLIEDLYVSGCSKCETDKATLETFANTFKDFVVLEEVEIDTNATNETEYVKLQMIGRTGLIEDLRETEITEESLTDLFCDMALAQPRECLLREM